RYFSTQRYVWALANPTQYDVSTVERDYYAVILEWNAKVWTNRNKIRLLVSEARANQFLDYQDDKRGDGPRSLHYRFAALNATINKAKRGELDIAKAQDRLAGVNHACSNFLESVTTDFLRRSAALELLDVSAAQEPPPPQREN